MNVDKMQSNAKADNLIKKTNAVGIRCVGEWAEFRRHVNWVL